MFIRYENITIEKLIDVRTVKEFNIASLAKYNIPIINEKEYAILKKCYPIAFIIIGIGLLKRRKIIKDQLMKISVQRRIPLVIACSRGRLRSPMLYLYCRLLGVKCKVLSKGIKPLLRGSDRAKLTDFL